MAKKFAILMLVIMASGTMAYADECNSVRYSENGIPANGDGTITDCRTGLIWLKNANCTESLGGISKVDGGLLWRNAMRWTAALSSGHCGLSDGSSAGDWRLPTKTEMMAMIASAKKQGFTNPVLTNAAGTAKWSAGNIFDNVPLAQSFYWTATTDASDESLAWYIDLYDGTLVSYNKNSFCFEWPVRGGQSGSFGHFFIH